VDGEQRVTVTFELFSTSFCGACRQTKSVLDRAAQLVPGLTVSEHDVAFEPDRAERLGIEATPTVIVRDADGREVSRAAGVPTIDDVLFAAARALDAAP
jgi:thiol-disulfide isomerase/thioredoxin